MATICKCDKCKKTIKNEDRNKLFSFYSPGIFSDVINKNEICTSLELCSTCSAPVIKYLTRYLKTKKTK